METKQIKSHRDLIVWQKSMGLIETLYFITKQFPREELYGLVSQMRRCVISIASNIAEGKARGTKKDYRHFLLNAYGSGAELETQIEIARRLGYITKEQAISLENQLGEVMRMLNSLISKLT